MAVTHSPTMTDQQTCPKCGSVDTRVIGRSTTPPITYLVCSRCGYSTSIAGGAPVSDSTPASSPERDGPRLEQLARRLIADLGLRLEVVGVTLEQGGWIVQVRTEANRVLKLTVKPGPPSAMRTALKEALEAT